MQERQGNEVQGKQAVGPHESSRLETTHPRLIPVKAVVWPGVNGRSTEPSVAITVKSG